MDVLMGDDASAGKKKEEKKPKATVGVS